jgi:hypothetical protein
MVDRLCSHAPRGSIMLASLDTSPILARACPPARLAHQLEKAEHSLSLSAGSLHSPLCSSPWLRRAWSSQPPSPLLLPLHTELCLRVHLHSRSPSLGPLSRSFARLRADTTIAESAELALASPLFSLLAMPLRHPTSLAPSSCRAAP